MRRFCRSIEFASYRLEAKVQLNHLAASRQREGALLRCTFADGAVGYADCHPWPELRDLPLEKQLFHLKKSEVTTLSLQSMRFARIDAEARAKKHSLFADCTIPSSHVIAYDLVDIERKAAQGFRVFKIKLGKQSKSLLEELARNWPKECRLRLDYNYAHNYISFQQQMRLLKPLLPYIDFIEDPFPFQARRWCEAQDQHSLSLAADHDAEEGLVNPHAANVIVCKPAVQTDEIFFRDKVIVTSYMDHPLGQLAAAYIAAQRKGGDHSCGILTHLLYETNPFSEQLTLQKDVLIPPPGTGFGFDELLRKQPWQPL